MYYVAMIWEDAELIKLRQWNCFMEHAPQLEIGYSKLGSISLL